MPKWDIFNASLFLNEQGHPCFLLNKNLSPLLFQRNYHKFPESDNYFKQSKLYFEHLTFQRTKMFT